MGFAHMGPEVKLQHIKKADSMLYCASTLHVQLFVSDAFVSLWQKPKCP